MKSQPIVQSSQIWGRRLMRVVAVLLLAISCHEDPQDVAGGETHFLTACDPDSPSCDPGTACVCGLCTRSCSEAAMCGDLAASAACVQAAERLVTPACRDALAPAYCDLRCSSDKDCASVTGAHRCTDGFCRLQSMTAVGGSSGTAGDTNGVGGAVVIGAAGNSAVATAGGSATCPASNVTGNEVLVLGDAFIAQSHQITAFLEDQARAARRLQSGERFRDYSTVATNSLAWGDTFIAQQYAKGQSEGTSKVVVLCGGGADVLAVSCPTPPTSDCQVLAAAAQAANQLLAQMAMDGILDVVWFFYPNPTDSANAAEMDVLRPLIQKACANSPVPCHWVDLRPDFEGHYAEYIRSDGMMPTVAGAQVAAEAIWSVMKRDCVAQ